MSKNRYTKWGYVPRRDVHQSVHEAAVARRAMVYAHHLRAHRMGYFVLLSEPDPGLTRPTRIRNDIPGAGRMEREKELRAVWMARNAAALQCELGRRAFVALTAEETDARHYDVRKGDHDGEEEDEGEAGRGGYGPSDAELLQV